MILGAFLCLLSLGSWAQTGQGVVVLEVEGKMKFTTTSGKKLTPRPGMVINRKGGLKMKEGASLKVLDGVEVVSVQVPGASTLSESLSANPAQEMMGFAGMFYQMINDWCGTKNFKIGGKGAGGIGTNPPPSVRTGGKGAGENNNNHPPSVRTGSKGAGGSNTNPPASVRTGGKGAGGKDLKIPGYKVGKASVSPMGNYPVHGKLSPTMVYFNAPEGMTSQKWTLRIFIGTSNKIAYETKSTLAYEALDLAKATGFTEGSAYRWETYAGDGTGKVAESNSFTLVNPSEESSALEIIHEQADYLNAGDSWRACWESYALEEAELYYSANQRLLYARVFDPKNRLLFRLYTGFWYRSQE